MRCSPFLPLLLCSLFLVTTSVQAERVILDDDLTVDYSPDSLALKPGGKGSVEFIFDNSGNETLFIALTQMVLKCAGGSRASIDPDFFELDAGENQTVVVTIETSTDCPDDCYSDSHIALAWGRDLTLADGHNLSLVGGRVEESTIDGGTTIIYQVTDVGSPCYLLTIGSIIVGVLIIILVIVAYVMLRRKRRGASPEVD
jgi:hypothetical protein